MEIEIARMIEDRLDRVGVSREKTTIRVKGNPDFCSSQILKKIKSTGFIKRF